MVDPSFYTSTAVLFNPEGVEVISRGRKPPEQLPFIHPVSPSVRHQTPSPIHKSIDCHQKNTIKISPQFALPLSMWYGGDVEENGRRLRKNLAFSSYDT
jgi:hypothetical protein